MVIELDMWKQQICAPAVLQLRICSHRRFALLQWAQMVSRMSSKTSQEHLGTTWLI